jgi:hypothetical protein
MRRRHGKDTVAQSQLLELVAPLKNTPWTSPHDRPKAADDNLMVGFGAKLSGGHADFAAVALDRQHRLRCILVERAVQPADEGGRSRFRQLPGGTETVDFTLQADMRPRLDLEIAPLLCSIELIGERPFDFAGGGVIPSIRFE